MTQQSTVIITDQTQKHVKKIQERNDITQAAETWFTNEDENILIIPPKRTAAQSKNADTVINDSDKKHLSKKAANKQKNTTIHL